MINADYSNYDPIEFFNFTNNTVPKSLSEKAMLDIATANNRAKDAILEKAAELAQVKHDAWISDFMYNQSKNRDNSIATKMDVETFDIRKRMYEDTSENIDYQKYLNEMRAVSKSIQDTDQLMKNAGYTFKDYDQQYIDELKKDREEYLKAIHNRDVKPKEDIIKDFNNRMKDDKGIFFNKKTNTTNKEVKIEGDSYEIVPPEILYDRFRRDPEKYAYGIAAFDFLNALGSHPKTGLPAIQHIQTEMGPRGLALLNNFVSLSSRSSVKDFLKLPQANRFLQVIGINPGTLMSNLERLKELNSDRELYKDKLGNRNNLYIDLDEDNKTRNDIINTGLYQGLNSLQELELYNLKRAKLKQNNDIIAKEIERINQAHNNK